MQLTIQTLYVLVLTYLRLTEPRIDLGMQRLVGCCAERQERPTRVRDRIPTSSIIQVPLDSMGRRCTVQDLVQRSVCTHGSLRYLRVYSQYVSKNRHCQRRLFSIRTARVAIHTLRNKE